MTRDKSEDERYGQKLLKTLQHADFFIRNVDENITNLLPRLERYLKLILGVHDFTPTVDEYAMYCAQSAALKSGCLSRQVGAAILSEDNTLIATGCNDVPKFGGGLYTTEDAQKDNRCMNFFDGKCKNDDYKNQIFLAIKKILNDNLDNQEGKEQIIKDIIDKISNEDRLKCLIEFSRAVHAEMDAIISVARHGNTSLKNSTLYCTTFPCHHCARHILAAGIKRVFYIEPYEKSLALNLHSDAIAFEPDDDTTLQQKLIFMPFEGVAPRQYMNLFRVEDRKTNGIKIETDLKNSFPSVVKFLDTHIQFEQKIVEHLKEKNIVL